MSRKEKFLESCLILDTETNSDDYRIAEIIEAGYVFRENGNWKIFQELYKPVEHPIPPRVESICYITNKMVEDKGSFIDSKAPLQDLIDKYARGYLVAHNHFFDMRVLERHMVDTSSNTWICTWRMVKKLFNGNKHIEETNLPYLRFALELDIPIDMYCHRAGNDSFITAKLLEFLVDVMEESGILDRERDYGPQIAKWAAAPILYERMPFGKHKNELMKDVPKSYWIWAMNKTNWFDETADNYDPDLAESINAVL